MKREDKNSGKDRIRNEGQKRAGGIAYIYELCANGQQHVTDTCLRKTNRNKGAASPQNCCREVEKVVSLQSKIVAINMFFGDKIKT